jgi:hypothetical protein
MLASEYHDRFKFGGFKLQTLLLTASKIRGLNPLILSLAVFIFEGCHLSPLDDDYYKM